TPNPIQHTISEVATRILGAGKGTFTEDEETLIFNYAASQDAPRSFESAIQEREVLALFQRHLSPQFEELLRAHKLHGLVHEILSIPSRVTSALTATYTRAPAEAARTVCQALCESYEALQEDPSLSAEDLVPDDYTPSTLFDRTFTQLRRLDLPKFKGLCERCRLTPAVQAAEREALKETAEHFDQAIYTGPLLDLLTGPSAEELRRKK
ncbi:MAG: hypothetical protein Q8O19_07065, partial [Rectinemataceae bacterium]|nr:hypothetical protein [Rectinemataceae bacterium]